jgi:hypothetical protein
MTGVGPIDQKVLQDLFTWPSDPVRDFKEFANIVTRMKW